MGEIKKRDWLFELSSQVATGIGSALLCCIIPVGLVLSGSSNTECHEKATAKSVLSALAQASLGRPGGVAAEVGKLQGGLICGAVVGGIESDTGETSPGNDEISPAYEIDLSDISGPSFDDFEDLSQYPEDELMAALAP